MMSHRLQSTQYTRNKWYTYIICVYKMCIMWLFYQNFIVFLLKGKFLHQFCSNGILYFDASLFLFAWVESIFLISISIQEKKLYSRVMEHILSTFSIIYGKTHFLNFDTFFFCIYCMEKIFEANQMINISSQM